MNIDNLCGLLLDSLKDAKYNESTIFNYEGVIRRFKAFCKEHGATEYTPEFGQLYADDVISIKTGKFSKQRYFSQGRFIRLLNSYLNTGSFDLAATKRGRFSPSNKPHLETYDGFVSFLRKRYDRESTVLFYDYQMLYFLQYLDGCGIYETDDITAQDVHGYMASLEQSRQRGALCGLNLILKYLERDDLSDAIKGIHAFRSRRIIPTLTADELSRLDSVLDSPDVSRKDAAIVTIGLATGIRAVDLINLRLSDIDWNNETISFTQSKTGNPVCIPLTVSVGNAIARYIVEERPEAPNDYLFVRELAPFGPLGGHSSCYVCVKRVFERAGISKDGRIWGTHMLRHNAASTMVKNGVPIETIAAVLGHSDTDSADVYITTDEERLRECVLPLADIMREVVS